MFVDAPTSFPHQQNSNKINQEDEDKDEKCKLPVTDLDCNQSPSPPSEEGDVKPRDLDESLNPPQQEEKDKTIELESQSVGAKETVVGACHDEKQQQKGNELVDPIYF